MTLTTAVPVTTADVTGATTIYCTPYKGNSIGLYDGAAWNTRTSAEFSLALGTLAAAFQAYDVFCYDNSGTPTLEFLEWQNGTITMTIATPCVVTWTGGNIVNGSTISFTTSGALPTGVSANTQYWVLNVSGSTFNIAASPTGTPTKVNTSGSQSGTHTGHSPIARTTALAYQDGVLVKSGTATRRYLGTFMSTATTTTEDSGGGTTTQVGGRRYLFNYYNRQPRYIKVFDSTVSWTYTGNTAWRIANAAAGNRVEFVTGLVEATYSANLMISFAPGSSGAGNSQSSIVKNGVDNTVDATILVVAGYGGTVVPCHVSRTDFPVLGYTSLQWAERGTQSGTTTWYGTGGASNGFQSGMIARVDA